MEMRLKIERPKPKPGHGELVVIPLLENDLLKSSDALAVDKKTPPMDTRVRPCALARKHANTKPFEGSFLKFEAKGTGHMCL